MSLCWAVGALFPSQTMTRPGSPAAHSNCIMRKFQEYLRSIRGRGEDRMGTAASYLLLCMFTDCIHYIHTSILHIWIRAALEGSARKKTPSPQFEVLGSCRSIKIFGCAWHLNLTTQTLKNTPVQHFWKWKQSNIWKWFFSFKPNYLCFTSSYFEW